MSTYFDSPTGKHAIYYHTSWSNYGRNYQVKDLPIDNITDVAYAFFNVSADGKVFSGDEWADYQNPYVGKGVDPQNSWSSPPIDLGNLGQFSKLRRQGKKFNFALSLGGWSWSTHFSEAVSTELNRQNLVSNIRTVFDKYPGLFNGVNIDWEYLSNDGVNYGNAGNVASKADADNFVQFLKLLRGNLGSSYRISIAVVAAPEKIKMPVNLIHPLVDEIHVMTYDFHDGSWGEKVGAHHTNLRKSSLGKYSVEEGVAAWLGYGVPSNKIYIGVAFYSRGFANSDGIGKVSSGGSPDKSWENGVVDYKALPLTGAKEMWDPEAHAGYSYDPTKKILNSYDTVQSVKEKCQFVFDNDLGGVIVWESSGDAPYNSEKSLMKVMRDNLTHGKPKDVPQSPRVIPTPPGGTFTPNAVRPVPGPPPVPGPAPVPVPVPAPTPTTTYPCEFCTVCSKTSNVPCKPKSAPTPPRPQPPPQPQPSPSIIKEWVLKTNYKVGDIVTNKGKQYRCKMGHSSIQVWAPDMAGALWDLM